MHVRWYDILGTVRFNILIKTWEAYDLLAHLLIEKKNHWIHDELMLPSVNYIELEAFFGS